MSSCSFGLQSESESPSSPFCGHDTSEIGYVLVDVGADKTFSLDVVRGEEGGGRPRGLLARYWVVRVNGVDRSDRTSLLTK